MPRKIISPITTRGIHSNTERSVLPKPSSSNGLRSDSIKVSLAALRINATPATIRPVLKAQSSARVGGRFATWRDLCRYAFKKPAFVEIAAYSTRYRRARQTTDDTKRVKIALASAGFASDVARMSPIFVQNEGYRARYTPLFDNVEQLLPTGIAMRYSGPLNPGRSDLPPAVPAAMTTKYCCHDGAPV